MKRDRIIVLVALSLTVPAMTGCKEMPSELSSQTESITDTASQTESTPEDTTPPNMDLSRVKITIPDRDEYHRLEFNQIPIEPESAEKHFQETYEFWFGEGVSQEEILAYGDYTGIPEEDVVKGWNTSSGEHAWRTCDVRFPDAPANQFRKTEYLRT